MRDGLDLYELADLMVDAGAVNAINLLGGSPAAMTKNRSAIVDPTGACPELDDGDAGFMNGSDIARCDTPVSSIICVHLEPPPFVPGYNYNGTDPPAEAGTAGHDDSGGSSSGDEFGEDSSGDDGGMSDERRVAQDGACNWKPTGNETLCQHIQDVEEAVFRYKVMDMLFAWALDRPANGIASTRM